MNFPFINNLKYKLSQPLPGSETQFQMAASFRKSSNKTLVSATAGVLLLLYITDNEWNIVLIKRPEYLGVHSAQISFPGGKFDSTDANLLHTALRETEEEIGVHANKISILGELTKLYIPPSEIEVYPFVGFCAETPIFTIDTREVQYVIEAKISDFINPANRLEKPYSSNETSGTIPYFNINGHEVWGATAMIINEFLAVIKT